MTRRQRILLATAAAVATIALTSSAAHAGTVYATGQLFIPADPTHDDLRENRYYALDTITGRATPVSPVLSGGSPAGLGATPDGQLFGTGGNGQLVSVDPFTGVQTPLSAPTDASTGFDILGDGRAYKIVPSGPSASVQPFQVNLLTGAQTSVGSASAISGAFNAAFGASTTNPQIISLGSLGNTLYGINLQSGRTNLFSFNVDTGVAQVIGAQNAIGGFAGGRYSGFSALTGVDENNDGSFDTLFGNINFDAQSPNPQNRIGALARFDLQTGTFNVVGQNPGLIFFGMASVPGNRAVVGSAVPEPGTLALLGLLALPGVTGLARRASERKPS